MRDVQYHGGYHDKCGRYLEHCGGVHYHGGYHENRGGYFEYSGGCSVQWEDTIHVGGVMSTVENVQYCGDTQITKDDLPLGTEHPHSAQMIPPHLS